MDTKSIIEECSFSFSRSGGKGGQHVNKVSTKAELRFNISISRGLLDEEKERLHIKLAHRITLAGELVLQCDDSRSQSKNKEIVTRRLLHMLTTGLKREKERKPTRKTVSSNRKRLEQKSKRASVKTMRRKPGRED